MLDGAVQAFALFVYLHCTGGGDEPGHGRESQSKVGTGDRTQEGLAVRRQVGSGRKDCHLTNRLENLFNSCSSREDVSFRFVVNHFNWVGLE